MRTKLGLTDRELMEKSWIALNLELIDYPTFNFKKKKRVVVSKEDTNRMLGKLFGR